MTPPRAITAFGAALLCTPGLASADPILDDPYVLPGAVTPAMHRADPMNDATMRRVDTLGSPIPPVPNRILPDIISLTVGPWVPVGGAADFPYDGTPPIDGDDTHFVRISIELRGLINPPGPLGLNALAFDPLRYGPSPIYGFIELDVDADQNTGGEIGISAESRYLVNAARFGGLPAAPRGSRAVQWGYELDPDFFTAPFYERSGADWALAFCGCHNTTKVSEFAGDNDLEFEAGEDWVVEGRFFPRAAGYRDGSAVFGGSGFGLYDPIVQLRFRSVPGPDQFDTDDDRTFITLVYPLTMLGAAELDASAAQVMNFNVADHTSIEEGLNDLIIGADSGVLVGPNLVLQDGWGGRTPTPYLDPGTWIATALVGTAYTTPGPDLYIWTDAGFDATFGDFNRNGIVDAADKQLVIDFIAAADGPTSGLDADGIINDSVEIVLFAANFIVADLDYDGDVDLDDANHPVFAFLTPPCEGDANGDDVVDVNDISFVLFRLGNAGPEGDTNDDGTVDVNDISYVLFRLGDPCP